MTDRLCITDTEIIDSSGELIEQMLVKDAVCRESLSKYFDGDQLSDEVDHLLFIQRIVSSWFDCHLQK